MDELSDEDGLHEYVFAPLAISMVDCPEQIVAAGETETTGRGFTVTVVCAVEVQPLRFPVTVYVVDEIGFAVTLEPADELSDDDGLHEYEFAPPADSTADCPVQIVKAGVTVTTGSGFTVTVVCAVEVQPLRFPVTV